MFNLFLLYVMVLGIVCSLGGLIVMELVESFNKKYKIVKRNGKMEMREEEIFYGKNSQKNFSKVSSKASSKVSLRATSKILPNTSRVKIAHNDGNIDIRMSGKTA